MRAVLRELGTMLRADAAGFSLVAIRSGMRPRLVEAVVTPARARPTGFACALLLRPEPELAGVMWFAHQTPTHVSRSDRTKLSRLALQIETALRFRLRPDTVRMTLDLRTCEPRHDVWDALAHGRWSLVQRTDCRDVYAVIENATSSHPHRRLTDTEAAVVRLAAQNLAGKAIAYALGLSPSAVSHALGNAEVKMGLVSPGDLTRVARALTEPSRPIDDARLTPAERDVLELVLAGKSNRQIGAARGRSERTVANQVASILAKTGAPSRRALRTLSTTSAPAEAMTTDSRASRS